MSKEAELATPAVPGTPPAPKQLVGMILYSAVIGIVAAVFAAFFLKLVELSTEFVYHELPHALGLDGAPWWWAGILLLIASAVVVLARKLPGSTGASPLTGFHFDVPVKFVPATLLAAFASLVAGVALGPEAPLIVLGVAVGGILSANRPAQIQKAMMFVGGAAAISAVFGNPFITGFMILEFIALGAVPVALLLPVLTALSSGYLVSIGIWSFPGLAGHPLTVSGLPDYPNINPGDILVGLVVALVAGLVALASRAGGEIVDRLAHKRSTLVLFGAAFVTTAVLGVAESLGIAQNQILFSGNSGMPGLIAQTSFGIVIFIVLAKAVAYAVALGGGFRGGPIFPVTYLGVGVGVLAALLIPGVNVSALAAAGIAGSAAAFLKLPATSALLGALLIAGAGVSIAPFAIFGAVVGFAVRVLADSRSAKATAASTTASP